MRRSSTNQAQTEPHSQKHAVTWVNACAHGRIRNCRLANFDVRSEQQKTSSSCTVAISMSTCVMPWVDVSRERYGTQIAQERTAGTQSSARLQGQAGKVVAIVSQRRAMAYPNELASDELGDVSMDSFNLKRSCYRRWYVILPLLLITAWYSYHFYGKVQPVYSAKSVIGLAAPNFRVIQTDPGAEVHRNGLLDVGGEQMIAEQAVLALRGPSVVDRVVAAGGVPWYVSKTLSSNSYEGQLPLITINVTASKPATVTKTLEIVFAQSQVTLRTLQQQAQVPEDQMITPFLVSPPSAPTAAYTARVPSTTHRFIVGVGLSILLTVLVDVLLTRRKSRAQQRRQALVEASAGPNPAHPPNTAGQSLSGVVTSS